jgi:hypothetical protein
MWRGLNTTGSNTHTIIVATNQRAAGMHAQQQSPNQHSSMAGSVCKHQQGVAAVRKMHCTASTAASVLPVLAHAIFGSCQTI